MILNIANEQNSGGYRDEPWGRVRNVADLLEMVRIAKAEHPSLIVGCGGYDHAKNVELGNSPDVDVLLFDTLGPDKQAHSGHWYDHFVANGVTNKPIVNVESFGAWTRAFMPPGVYTEEGKETHYREIADAAERPGLSVFLHSNPWCQGPADGFPVRYDLAGRGTADAPGIRWWFERVRQSKKLPFTESGGELVIEAEDFATKSPSTYGGYTQVHTWHLKTDTTGYSGEGFMQVLPDERPESGEGPSSPRNRSGAELTYPIRVENPGTYIVWVRGRAMGGESNGLHVGLNGELEGKGLDASNMSDFRPHKAWQWDSDRKHGFSEPARIDLPAGDHTLHVWNRDDGFRFDKLILRRVEPVATAKEASVRTRGVAVARDQVLLNGHPVKVLGLRCSNALISDATADALIGQLDFYKAHGLNTVSVFFMGSRFGDVRGYRPDASLDPVYAGRMGRILKATAERDMIVIVGCLYWSTSKAKAELGHWEQADANRAVANTARWLKEKEFANVILDPDNEGMAWQMKKWEVQPMIAAAKAAYPSLVVANNTKQDPPNEDLNMHFGDKEPGKPWFDSEAVPKNVSGGYWSKYSKETHQADNSYYNYSRIGRYTEEMKANQLKRTRDEVENYNGYMLASTWLQCPPAEGVGGPFATPGGLSSLGSVSDKGAEWNQEIDKLHPDAGILWWLEFVRDEVSTP